MSHTIDPKLIPFTRRFKSEPVVSFDPSNVDEENGIIRNVVMCQVGPAKGHGISLDQEYINELVAYDIKHYSETGLKARFSHPSMSNTAMGTQMGVFKNFSVRGEQAIADLHLLESANLSPNNPGIKDFMLSIAKEKPEFVMMSIVASAGYFFQKNENGEKHILAEKVNKTKGYNHVNEFKEELGDVFMGFGEFGTHPYTDAVEAGAATDSLFSQQFNKDKFAVQAVEFLHDHPEIHNFLKDNPGKLIEFAEKAGVQLPTQKETPEGLFSQLKSHLFGDKPEAPEVDLTQYIKLNDHQDALNAKDDELGLLQESLTQLKSDKDAEITQLNATIEELEKEPADPPVELGEEPTLSDEETPTYMMDQNTQKLMNK